MESNKIIIGNWKMNGSVKSLSAMIEALKSINPANKTVILCPPYPFIGAASISPVSFGAQDTSQHESGAYTGDVSAEMIAETGTKYVIVGHSERRLYHNETNEIVAEKAHRAFRAGLVPIICVGESAAQRDAGQTLEIIKTQIQESIPGVLQKFIIAYEPVWSAGTDKLPALPDIEKAHAHIYNVLADMGKSAPVVYGGSVSAKNAGEIMAAKNIDGVMVGRASLAPKEFISIIGS